MAETSPVCPARRAPQRRRILDSPDEDLDAPVKNEPLSDEDAHQTSPKRVARKTSTRSNPMSHSRNVDGEELADTGTKPKT